MKVFGTHQENTLAQLADVATRAERVALMADGHLGYVMPIGGVAAYRNKVSVVGVGFDIACGNCAIKTDLTLDDERIASSLTEIADEIQHTVSFGMGRTNKADDAPTDHALFDSEAWSLLPGSANIQNLQGKARAQLGTVGSGNHYVDVFADETGAIWVGVHFGSRGLGHTIASGFLALSQGEKWGARVPEKETLLSLDEPLGADYWALMNLAGEYAYAGREWVARKTVELLGGREVEMVHNHHNFAWKESHAVSDDDASDIEELIVVRKGATPAFPGQKGFVGGSMGDDSVILEAADDAPEAQGAMYSTVHGAGRVMSRTEAAGKWDRKTKQLKSAGEVSQEMLDEWLAAKGVVLRGGGLDESPHAYRRLPDVLEAQGSTINVLQTLTPLIVVMAGANEFDPYKD
ncbi:MAG: RtcB family protein [Gemmatimonadota bacterium]|nr:RtcB family protein [Gemmatimonadota bacterium]